MKLIFNVGYQLEDALYHMDDEEDLRSAAWAKIFNAYKDDPVNIKLQVSLEIRNSLGEVLDFRKLEYKRL